MVCTPLYIDIYPLATVDTDDRVQHFARDPPLDQVGCGVQVGASNSRALRRADTLQHPHVQTTLTLTVLVCRLAYTSLAYTYLSTDFWPLFSANTGRECLTLLSHMVPNTSSGRNNQRNSPRVLHLSSNVRLLITDVTLLGVRHRDGW
jgi:hypothetical protein